MARRSRKAPRPSDRRPLRVTALVIFVAALASRLLFWQATPDRAWAWTAYFKGDAPVWLDYARAIDQGQTFELGLPIHPPGAAWLVALLWNGLPSGIAWLRFSWVFMGALVPLVVFLAAERSFGFRVAVIAGGWSAISTGLLILSTSINNETPYLVLALGSLWFVKDLRERPRIGRIALWSALSAIACLFRVEHVLFYLLVIGFLAIGWIRSGASGAAKLVMTSFLFFALPLLPWHFSAWSAIRRFNEEPRRLTPMEERAVRGVEESLPQVRWTAEAQRRRDELPAFLGRTAAAFVLATVYHRGGREVRGEDLDILEQAFGYFPRPLRRFPFVSSYGPLNFALANHSGATGGFDRSLLEQAPPLAGGAMRYPSFLVQGLPPERFTFVYPPHLRLFNEGYSIGCKWIADHPREFARLAARKVSIFWSGAALGVTGYNLPLGLSGLRRSVDLVTPDGGASWIFWRPGFLVFSALGLLAAWRHSALWPWLLLLASKVVVTILFFGYGRQGATMIPILAVLSGLAADRWIFPRVPPLVEKRAAPLLLAMLLIAVGVDAARFIAKPVVRLAGRTIGAVDPFPPDLHRDHRLEIRH